MSSIADLNAAQAALTAVVENLSAAQAAAFKDIADKMAALQAAQPDLPLDGINAAIAKLGSLIGAVTAADPGPQPTA